MLRETGTVPTEEAWLSRQLRDRVEDGMIIAVRSAFPVTVIADGTVDSGCPLHSDGGSKCTGQYNDGIPAAGLPAVAGTGQEDNPHIGRRSQNYSLGESNVYRRLRFCHRCRCGQCHSEPSDRPSFDQHQ